MKWHVGQRVRLMHATFREKAGTEGTVQRLLPENQIIIRWDGGIYDVAYHNPAMIEVIEESQP